LPRRLVAAEHHGRLTVPLRAARIASIATCRVADLGLRRVGPEPHDRGGARTAGDLTHDTHRSTYTWTPFQVLARRSTATNAGRRTRSASTPTRSSRSPSASRPGAAAACTTATSSTTKTATWCAHSSPCPPSSCRSWA